MLLLRMVGYPRSGHFAPKTLIRDHTNKAVPMRTQTEDIGAPYMLISTRRMPEVRPLAPLSRVQAGFSILSVPRQTALRDVPYVTHFT